MKGISPLISAVLLIAFTVAVAGIVSIFFTSFTKSTTGSVSSQGGALIACSGSQPTVDLVRYNSTNVSWIIVTYTNPGSVQLISVAAYITLTNATTFQVSTTLVSSTLNSYASGSFNVSSGISSGSGGAPTEVRIVGVCSTTSGNQTVSGNCLTGQACMSSFT